MVAAAFGNTDENGIPIAGVPVPDWNKNNPPYNVLAYLIKTGKVTTDDKAAKVRRMLPILDQYPGDRFRVNYNNQHKYFKAGTLKCNEGLIPPGLMAVLRDGSFKTKFKNNRPADEKADINDAKECKCCRPVVSFLKPPLSHCCSSVYSRRFVRR
jgi:hypothetical protein